MNKTSFGKGLQDGIPIGLGYFAVSFTFGIMAIQSGLTAWQAVLISLTNLTSAGQFAGIGIIAAGGSLWEMALTQLVINLRYCLMSFSLSQKLEKGVSNGHRLAVAFGVTDEIFGVSASQEGRISPWYNYGVMCVAIPGWTLGTLAGAVSGSLLPDFLVSALSVAIYGMFLAVIIPPAKKNRAFPTGNALLYISLSHVDFSGCVLFRGAPCFLFCLISPYSAVLFSLPTGCKRRPLLPTPRTQTTLFRSKISNALMTQSSLLARREFFRTSPHYKSAPIRSFCDFEQRASPKNHQKVELHKTSLQSCRVLL